MIREATIMDAQRINELGLLLHSNFDHVFHLDEMLDDAYTKVIVYENNEKILGFLIATHIYETCDILSIIVDPEYRRKGIASNLITYLISDCGEQLKLVTLEVASKNEAAIELYEKFGFEKIHTRNHYYPDGDDAYLMARKSES